MNLKSKTLRRRSFLTGAGVSLLLPRMESLGQVSEVSPPRRLLTIVNHLSFYQPSSKELDQQWMAWLHRWHALIKANDGHTQLSVAMQRINPAITWREWLIAPAYQQAEQGDNSHIVELQHLFRTPYDTPPAETASRYDRLRPHQYFGAGGISHYSCSS